MLNEETGLTAKLVKHAVETKLENLRSTGETTHSLYDRMVFKRTKALLGGRVRMLVTGSAPISPDILEFLKICFCAPILEGYG
jgi:long-chain acyl-CoA synthetase